jgi:hypothetical protein
MPTCKTDVFRIPETPCLNAAVAGGGIQPGMAEVRGRACSNTRKFQISTIRLVLKAIIYHLTLFPNLDQLIDDEIDRT